MLIYLYMYVFTALNLIIIFFSIQDTFLVLSFVTNLGLISYGIYYSMKKRWLNVDIVIWNFKYLFFLLAPLIQINNNVFPNNLPITNDKILFVNFILSIWFFLYICVRNKNSTLTPEEQFNFNHHNITQKVYMYAAVLITLLILGLFGFDFSLGYDGWGSITANKSNVLLLYISTAGIVYGNFIFQYEQFMKNKNVVMSIKVLLSFMMLLIVVNPFNMARYYIGFVVISLLFLFFRNKISNLLFNVFILMGIFILFPLANFFRFGFTELHFNELYQVMFQQFNELHFDAYANIIATVDYVQEYGIAFGYQLLGAIFFFVPRVFWENKPLQSGEVIGNFLIDNGYLNYNNLANALPSEMYINFGLLGIIIGPIALAYIVNYMERNAKKEFLVYALFSGFIFFIFRGALMSGFAYCFGTIVVIKYGAVFMNTLLKRKVKDRHLGIAVKKN